MSFIENDKDFQWVMKSINNIKDSNRDFRIMLTEFINDLSSSNDDEYFFNSLPFLQFVNEGNDVIAYTKPDKFLYLNAPKGGGVGADKPTWDFIFCHECLHQLWETFEVAETIKRKDGSYNHDVLNIASDCVINHYLRDMRHKKPFNNGIFPEVIKNEFNVEYDPKTDTQLTLYYKIMKSPVTQAMQKAQKLAQQMGKEGKGMQGGGSGQQQQSSGGGQQSSSGGQQSSNSGQQQQGSPSDRAENAANSAQQSADNAQEAANKAKANGDTDADAKQKAADKAKKAADKAKKAADKAKKAEGKGDMNEAEKQAKEAEKAAQEAEQANKEAGGQSSGQQNDNNSDNSNNGSKQAGTKYGDDEMTLDDMKRWHEDVIKEARNKIAGAFGDFVSKCKSSKSGEVATVKMQNGNPSWNKALDYTMNKIIKIHVQKKKREMQPTYSRIKRGSEIVQMGMPIKPGQKIKEDKLDISFAFYVDRSGSMNNCIDKVFKAVWSISDGIFKNYKKEKVVGDIRPTFFAFDYDLHKLKYGQKMSASGGTMSLNDLVDNIKTNTKDAMINIILTDGGLGDSKPENVYRNLKNIDGNVIIICNDESACSELDDIAKKSNGRVISIHADSDFTVK